MVNPVYCTGKHRGLSGFARLLVVMALCAASPVQGSGMETSAVQSHEQFDSELRGAASAIEKAAAMGNLWLGTRDLLDTARTSHQAGDDAVALALVRRARRYAELAANQAALEHARFLVTNLPPDHDPVAVAAVHERLRAYDGAAALQMARALRGD